MPELDEYDVMDEISPAEAARTALQVADQMRQEEASLGPVVTSQQALNFVPQTRTDLTRLPGQVFPPVDPARLASKVIGGPAPAVIPDPTAEMLDTARRFGVSPEVVMRAETMRRAYDAQRAMETAGKAGWAPERIWATYGAGALQGKSLAGLSRLATSPPTRYQDVAGQLVQIPPGGTPTIVPGIGRPPATRPPPETALEKAYAMQIDQAIKEGDDEKLRTAIGLLDRAQSKRLGFSQAPPAIAAPTGAAVVARKKPTKALAADYVKRLGQSKAIEQLKAEGYDVSGYAD